MIYPQSLSLRRVIRPLASGVMIHLIRLAAAREGMVPSNRIQPSSSMSICPVLTPSQDCASQRCLALRGVRLYHQTTLSSLFSGAARALFPGKELFSQIVSTLNTRKQRKFLLVWEILSVAARWCTSCIL